MRLRGFEDGAILIVDRKNDLTITGGFKVFPAEIEWVIAAHPSIAMVAVGIQSDEFKGQIAKAYVVLKPGASGEAEGILSDCREQLAGCKRRAPSSSWPACRKPRLARSCGASCASSTPDAELARHAIRGGSSALRPIGVRGP
jgi:acyl-CoA synthetase (AMP-forming)/AMP-acid ligase II